MSKSIWAALALAAAATAPAACSEEPAPAETGPQAPAGVAVSNARLMLPAVSGNPGVLYFDAANTGERPAFIRKVAIDGAGSTTLHQMGTWNNQPSMDEIFQIDVPAGGAAKLEPGGLHVMANDLAGTVTAGGSAQVTVFFVGGDELSFPAEVRAAGDER